MQDDIRMVKFLISWKVERKVLLEGKFLKIFKNEYLYKDFTPIELVRIEIKQVIYLRQYTIFCVIQYFTNMSLRKGI